MMIVWILAYNRCCWNVVKRSFQFLFFWKQFTEAKYCSLIYGLLCTPTCTQSLIRNSENRKATKTESFFMEVNSKLNTTVAMTTMTTLTYPLLQDSQARCNVPLLPVYVQVYSSVWACLCLKFYWTFYLEIKSTLVILWSIFIPLTINKGINNIYQLVLISCAILSLSSWPLFPLPTIPKSEKFRFPKCVWSQRFRIRDYVPVLSYKVARQTFSW
jgi:hypothetical protein